MNGTAQYRALAGFVAASAVFVAVFVALTLSAFHRPVPHDLPVGLVGPATVTGQVEHALDGAVPGGFRFRSYPSEASAATGIAQRAVDGAVVVSGADRPSSAATMKANVLPRTDPAARGPLPGRTRSGEIRAARQ
jgi:hypothetical protein